MTHRPGARVDVPGGPNEWAGERVVGVHRGGPASGPVQGLPSQPAPQPTPSGSSSPGLFGARRRVQILEAENAQLVAQLHAVRAELAQFRTWAGGHAEHLQRQIAGLQNRDAAALAQETQRAAAELAQVREQLGQAQRTRAAEERAAGDVREEVVSVRAENAATVRAAEAEAARIVAEARVQGEEFIDAAKREAQQHWREVEELEARKVATEDVVMLQEAGIYDFRHRLDDAVAYKTQLEHLKEAHKTLVRRDAAILATTNWTVSGSESKGRKMVRDFSKLMLRAYNAEADNCVRSMKPYRLDSAIDRLTKARDTIAKLGQTMDIRIDPGYHSVRIRELEMTADHLAKQDEEKERIRAERERQRDEEAARREFEREKARLSKERAHWERVHRQWESSGEDGKVSEAQAKLTEIDDAIAGVEAREANIRTGCVYVISNVGAFGENMVKVGLTRRLDPRERVRELGDASVPFKFDIHALVFSEDAVGLETRLHHELSDRRVNRVNLRREFFRATPAEVLTALQNTEARDHLLEFTEFAEAPEWRASLAATS